ncbi:MAG: helix-turn-helix domain-containing protein [Bacteroidota bacterium]|nr:helix-turn-helix domain-containing protein [Bacteroidota bacterium]
MNKKLHILRHSTLQVSSIDDAHVLPDFSAFVVDFKIETDFDFSILKQSFRFDFFSVIHIVSGNITSLINFKEIVIEKGELFITTPNSINQIINISDDCVIEGVSFTATFLADLNQQVNYVDMMEYFSSKYNPLWRLTHEQEKRFSDIVRDLQCRMNLPGKHTYGKEILNACFTIFLFEIADMGAHSATLTNFKYGRKEELVIKFIRLVQKNSAAERNLAFYSKQLCITSKYLSETIKEITGKTAGEIIDDSNIQEAKRLLANVALSVSEVAFELNFSTPAFFSKFFKRHTGLSPRDYRLELTRKSQVC